MTVSLKLVGFPDLCRRLGTDEIAVDVRPTTVGGLLDWFQKTHAAPMGTRLFDREGRVDAAVQIIRNGQEWLHPDQLDVTLPTETGWRSSCSWRGDKAVCGW